MFQVIASPQDNKFVAVRPGQRKGMQLPYAMYRELGDAAEERGLVPAWFADAARTTWGLDLAGQAMSGTVLVRPQTPLNYSRATWELNLGCNFNCEHCYLPERPFEGLTWEGRRRLLRLLRDAGVLWLQITGGEPTIDRQFMDAYEEAYSLGMLIEILTNGSRLHRPELLEMLTAKPAHKVTVSLYGASAESFDGLTRKPGAFRLLMKGLDAAREAGVSLELTLIVTRHNAHEVEAMRELARAYAVAFTEYSNISPTYSGGAEPLSAQSTEFLHQSEVFKGCPAGHTFFHVDPHGMATMCKVGRENPINLVEEGLDGLLRLPGIADAQMLRTGGCAGCQLSDSCRVCRPMAKAYQAAKAPLKFYCQHAERTPA